jgi:hypothetical protein
METKVEITHVKCACADCVCIVPVDKGIPHDGKLYCSVECARHHHGKKTGCGHPGCNCHG